MTSILSLKREIEIISKALTPKQQVQYIVEVVGNDGTVYDRWIIPTGTAPLTPKYPQVEDTEL
jgi:hypothetical protein